MRTIRFVMLLVAAVALLCGSWAWAEDAAPPPAPAAEKIGVPMKVEPNEARVYKVAVHMTGRLAVDGSGKLTEVDAAYTMSVHHKYGRRANDGLLPLDIAVTAPQAVVAGEKLAMPPTDFPKFTLLIDRSWKITNIFGLAGTRYVSQIPGFNYSNLIMLFFVPDGATPHAIGESWSSKVKLPSLPGECAVKTTLKSMDDKAAVKTVTIAQEYVWPQRKMDDGSFAASKAAVESVFALDTGKLLKLHAECQVGFAKSATDKQDKGQGEANTKIDISLVK